MPKIDMNWNSNISNSLYYKIHKQIIWYAIYDIIGMIYLYKINNGHTCLCIRYHRCIYI